MSTAPSLLQVRGLAKTYPMPARLLDRVTGRSTPGVPVIQDIDLDVGAGEVVGLVGESGSGKSTTAMTIMRLQAADRGTITFSGSDVTRVTGPGLLAFRRQAQIVLQDPYQSINPRFTILDTVAEPLVVHGLARGAALRERVLEALSLVGLPDAAALLHRRPAVLSGGQRQRVSIARGMILSPRLLVADEPVSMLDVSIRAGILNLIRRLARDHGLGVLYISHDIATVRYLCHRVAVMYLGRIVEAGATEEVLSSPQHPYTQALVAAVPSAAGARRPRVVLRQADGSNSTGCRFSPRCLQVMPVCSQSRPALVTTDAKRLVACHRTQAGDARDAGTLASRREQAPLPD